MKECQRKLCESCKQCTVIWETERGEQIPICYLEWNHLSSIIIMMEKRFEDNGNYEHDEHFDSIDDMFPLYPVLVQEQDKRMRVPMEERSMNEKALGWGRRRLYPC
jgi:hypothetical protein